MHNRDLWVDYARGIGIFLVVAGHVSRGVFNAGIEMNTELFKLTDSIIYSFHMPLFFFLSGLFVLPSFEKYGRNGLIAEKINSVFYPYVVWSLLQGLIEVALSRFTTAKTSIPEVLAFLWQPRAQFWFLYVLLLIFVIAAVLLRPHSKKYNGLFPLLAIPAWLAQIFFKLPFPLDFIANYAIFFFLGMRFNEIKHIFQQKSLLLTLVGLGSFLIFQYQFHIRLGLFYADKSLLTLPLALSGILLVISFSHYLTRIQPRFGKVLAIAGRYSMPVYLMHILAGSGVRILLSKGMHVQNVEMHIAIGIATAVIVPIVAYRFTQSPRFHFLRYLFTPPAWLAIRPGHKLN